MSICHVRLQIRSVNSIPRYIASSFYFFRHLKDTCYTYTKLCGIPSIKRGLNAWVILRTDFVNGILMLPRIEICHFALPTIVGMGRSGEREKMSGFCVVGPRFMKLRQVVERFRTQERKYHLTRKILVVSILV